MLIILATFDFLYILIIFLF